MRPQVLQKAATARMKIVPFYEKVGKATEENECGCSQGRKRGEREHIEAKRQRSRSCREASPGFKPRLFKLKHELYNTMAYWPPLA